MEQVIQLQIEMFLYIFAGVFLKKKEIITKKGHSVLTNIVINLILPCNIVKSFLITFNMSIVKEFLTVLIVAIVMQEICGLLAKFLYKSYDSDAQTIMKYGTVCSNGAFLGNAIIESIMGASGVSYASIYLIPQRIIMWTAGISLFSRDSADKKDMIEKIVLHPCMIAVYIGVFFMLTGIALPVPVKAVVGGLSGCTMPMSMIVIGSILADSKIQLKNFKIYYYCVIRLVLLPLIALIICSAFSLPNLITGVALFMTAMPAGTTTVIFADKYNKNVEFATQVTIISTILSLLTLPLWQMVFM